jgi:hypothetical protein
MRTSNTSVFMLLGSQKALVVGCRDYISWPQRSGPYAVLKVELGGIENMLCIRSQRLARCILATSKSRFASIRGEGYQTLDIAGSVSSPINHFGLMVSVAEYELIIYLGSHSRQTTPTINIRRSLDRRAPVERWSGHYQRLEEKIEDVR